VREVEQVLKVAMGIEISQGSMTLRGQTYEGARQLLSGLMDETSARITHLTTHPRMALVQEIQDVLVKFGTVKERDLLKRFYRQLSYGEVQFYESLNILVRSGVITKVMDQKGVPSYKLKKEED
jgi:hypothetical protein